MELCHFRYNIFHLKQITWMSVYFPSMNAQFMRSIARLLPIQNDFDDWTWSICTFMDVESTESPFSLSLFLAISVITQFFLFSLLDLSGSSCKKKKEEICIWPTWHYRTPPSKVTKLTIESQEICHHETIQPNSWMQSIEIAYVIQINENYFCLLLLSCGLYFSLSISSFYTHIPGPQMRN